ncbi:MAG: C39 family peptidase [Minisyncoccota bacterium]
MKLLLPYAKQHTNYSCGPTSLKMVLEFLGDKKSEKILIKKARTNKTTGTKHKWMIETAIKEGFYCYANSNSSLHEIKHFLLLGLPVIIDYTEPSENIGHYAVVIGYKKNKMILNDPWNGKNFLISEKDLINKWHDNITKSHGWIMAISKKDLFLGKQYLPKK